MKLERLGRMSPSWLLDTRYEIILSYNHGYALTVRDLQTMLPNPAYDPNDAYCRKYMEQFIPQEHTYFTGGGMASKEYGLHNVDVPSDDSSQEDTKA